MIDTSLDSSNFYFLFAVFQGVVLSIIILFYKPFTKPNLFFGILIFLFTLSLLHLLLEESIQGFNAKFPIPMDFSFSYGPLAYLHVVYIKNPARIFKKKELLHFLPSFLLDGAFFVAIFLYIRYHIEWAYENLQFIQSLALVMAIIGIIQLSYYTYLTYKESSNSNLILKDFTAIRKWIKYLLIIWIVIISFVCFAAIIALWNIEQFDEHSSAIYKPLGSLVGLSIYVLGYTYLLKYRKTITSYMKQATKFHFNKSETLEKNMQLEKFLADKMPYLDSTLTLAKLAKQLGWPINHLSKIINEVNGSNFNDFVNHYRVEAFKTKIQEPENKKYSIIGLSEEVGFSSKASFYRAFKKETSMTPSDFLNNVSK